MISDPVAVKHIINDRDFIRAPSQLQMGKLVFGERSVYCAEGEIVYLFWVDGTLTSVG